MEIVEYAINYAGTKVRKWNLPKNSRIKSQRRMPRELTKDAHLIQPKTSKEIRYRLDYFHGELILILN